MAGPKLKQRWKMSMSKNIRNSSTGQGGTSERIILSFSRKLHESHCNFLPKFFPSVNLAVVLTPCKNNDTVIQYIFTDINTSTPHHRFIFFSDLIYCQLRLPYPSDKSSRWLPRSVQNQFNTVIFSIEKIIS